MGLNIAQKQKVDVIAQLERMIANDKLFPQDKRDQFGGKKLEMVESLIELKITPANKVQVLMKFEEQYRSHIDAAKKELIAKEAQKAQEAQEALQNERNDDEGNSLSRKNSPTVTDKSLTDGFRQKLSGMFSFSGKSLAYSPIGNNKNDDNGVLRDQVDSGMNLGSSKRQSI